MKSAQRGPRLCSEPITAGVNDRNCLRSHFTWLRKTPAIGIVSNSDTSQTQRGRPCPSAVPRTALDRRRTSPELRISLRALSHADAAGTVDRVSFHPFFHRPLIEVPHWRRRLVSVAVVASGERTVVAFTPTVLGRGSQRSPCAHVDVFPISSLTSKHPVGIKVDWLQAEASDDGQHRSGSRYPGAFSPSVC